MVVPLTSRRALLRAAGASVVALAVPAKSRAAVQDVHALRLTAQPSQVALLGPGNPKTAVWSYNGVAPGPEIRARQGEMLRVVVANRLDESTTVHWHGIRLPNAMDGVPDITQAPIEPGHEFAYEFAPPNAGTYMYHSHQRGNVQVPMGLFGPLIVVEREPVAVDRDLTWVLSDWRLTSDGQISEDFGNMMDIAMAGRIGDVVTVNNRLPASWPVRAGERIRLRIINLASARMFALSFDGHRPQVIAWDGQPVEPYELGAATLVLGPGMRADLLIDMIGEPQSAHAVRDTFYPGQSYRLATFAYAKDKALSGRPMKAPFRLPPNTLPEPDVNKAARHLIAFAGGMMGGMMGGRGGMMGGGGMMGRGRGMMGGGMMGDGAMWTINGVAARGTAMEPFLTLDRGRSYVLSLRNDTGFFHPIHLHGHSFRVIARNGTPTRRREWRDTVLIPPREDVDVAFVADNPGDWMIHCHILDHQEAGMMGVIRVGR